MLSEENAQLYALVRFSSRNRCTMTIILESKRQCREKEENSLNFSFGNVVTSCCLAGFHPGYDQSHVMKPSSYDVNQLTGHMLLLPGSASSSAATMSYRVLLPGPVLLLRMLLRQLPPVRVRNALVGVAVLVVGGGAREAAARQRGRGRGLQ